MFWPNWNKKNNWTPEELSKLIYDNVSFIHDCHMRIDQYTCCDKKEFWHDDNIELIYDGTYYFFEYGDSIWELSSINGSGPDEYLYPSLNEDGNPICRIAILSGQVPEVIVLNAKNDSETIRLEVNLKRSSFFKKEIFSEDVIGAYRQQGTLFWR